MPAARIITKGSTHRVVGFSNDVAAGMPGSAAVSQGTLRAATEKPTATRLKIIQPTWE